MLNLPTQKDLMKILLLSNAVFIGLLLGGCSTLAKGTSVIKKAIVLTCEYDPECRAAASVYTVVKEYHNGN